MPHHAIHARFVETAAPLSPPLAAAIERAGPLELPNRADLPLAEYLCRAVAGQQLSVKAARTIWGRVEASANGAPLLDHFRDENADALRACGLSGAKTRAVLAIAETARAGGLDAAGLRDLSTPDRAAVLSSLHGVGPWTADMVNIFWFGDPDVWPDGDVAARKTLIRLTSPRRKTVRTAARFAPHRSFLALYMWAHIDAPPA